MPTIVTHTAANLTELAAIATLIGTNDCVSDDEHHLVYVENNGSTYDISATNLDFRSMVTDATRTVVIMPALGDSLWENLGPSDPIRYYGVSKGTTFEHNDGSGNIINLPDYGVLGAGFQLLSTGASGAAWHTNCKNTSVLLGNLYYFTHATAAVIGWHWGIMQDCFVISLGTSSTTSGLVRGRSGSKVLGCVVMRPSDAVANVNSGGVIQNYGGITVRNTAVFGFDGQAAIAASTESNNATDDTSSAPVGLQSLTVGDQFVNTTIAGLDLRLKSDADLVEAASPTYTTTEDIFGTTRDATNPDIGPYEYKSLAPNNAGTGDVVITGSLVQRETITGDISALTDVDVIDTDTLAYEWRRDGVAIGGATSITYVPVFADLDPVETTFAVSYTDEVGWPETHVSAAVLIQPAPQQYCWFSLTSNPILVTGPDPFSQIVLKIKNIPAEFFDGVSASSAEDGGGNITVHTAIPFTDDNRLAIKINGFDTDANTYDLDVLCNSFSNALAETIYVYKSDIDQVQPDADEPFGSDLIDNAVTWPENAYTTETEGYSNTEAGFWTASGLSCVTIGGVTITEGSIGFMKPMIRSFIRSFVTPLEGN